MAAVGGGAAAAERGVVKVDGEVLTSGAECFCGRGRLVGQICDQISNLWREGASCADRDLSAGLYLYISARSLFGFV